MLKKLFGYDSSVTTVKREILAGITTFLTMSYILVVNPDILSATGMEKGALFTATALASAIGTFLLAIYAKMPLAQAPSMGINAFFAYTLVLAMGYSWQTALAATFVEGIIFILLTLFNVREKIVGALPVSLCNAMTVGIGFFIAFIGLKSGGIIENSESTLVTLATFSPSQLIALLGIIISGVLIYRKVRGALLISILICTLLSLAMGITKVPQNFSPVSMPASIESTFMQLDFKGLLSLDMIITIALLVFMDLFNTIGTLVGAAYQANMVGSDGEIPRIKQSLMSDAVATSVGAVLGTSTVTTYTESCAGVAEGGRSGLTAFTTAVLFLVALFFSPAFMLVPSLATTGALVIVGVMMSGLMKMINFDDMSEALPAFITIIVMILSYSIADGIAMGIISYTMVKLLSSRTRELNVSIIVITILLVAKFAVDAVM